jgi:hypothetical protein
MFRTCVIKNYKRANRNRIAEKTLDECSVLRPDERTLPYFEVVHEQILADSRYLSLNPQQQGQFLRLVVHVLAPENGIFVRHAGAISKRLGLEKAVWENLETILINAGLLVVVDGGDYLMQYELREQYLQSLETNNAKRRNK